MRSRSNWVAAYLGGLLRSFLELQIAMALVALVCLLVGHVNRRGYHPGTVLFVLGDLFFLSAPVVTWMVFRDRGSRHSLELTMAMLAPVAGIVVLGELTRSAYLLWLVSTPSKSAIETAR
ncbi:MAG: hypothetical protein E6I60_12045 [Chloroflexi bacterium]|nr:MAG: hypothetical protein E6I60_12045 [Chloroflexota bacterium]